MIILKDGKPFEGASNLDAAKIAQFVRDGIWSEDDLERHGLVAAEPFVVPEGKVKVGEPRYAGDEGKVYEEYDLEDAPPAPPEPDAQEKIAAMLDAYGLTLADLKEALAK